MKRKRGHRRKGKKALAKKSPRIHRVAFLLNDDEYNALTSHFVKYNIANKSRWYRELIFTNVFRSQEEDYPTLFDESEMRG